MRLGIVVTLLLATLGCAARSSQEHPRWGPFRGHIVDADTGVPIAGAVFLVIWHEVKFGLVHSTERFYDAREAVTDGAGYFEVPRLWIPPWRLPMDVPRLTWFAPGYRPEGLVVTSNGQQFVDPTIIRMRRLTTREERLQYLDRIPPMISGSKMPRMLEAVNRERTALGLQPITRGDDTE